MSAIAIAFAVLATGPLSWQAAQTAREALAGVPCLVEARSPHEARLVITVATQHVPTRAWAWSDRAHASLDGQHLIRITAVLDRQRVVHDSSHSATQLTISVQVGSIWLRLPTGGPEAAARAGAHALARSLARLCEKEASNE